MESGPRRRGGKRVSILHWREESDPGSRHFMDTGFSSRMEIGRLLATRLGRYAGRRDVLVLALPGGGLEIASAAAEILGAPLDIIGVRRLPLPAAAFSVGAVVARPAR